MAHRNTRSGLDVVKLAGHQTPPGAIVPIEAVPHPRKLASPRAPVVLDRMSRMSRASRIYWSPAFWQRFPRACWSEEPAARPKHTNRLAKETSPYLLQHAHNPVDWYPWGEEALAKAKKEGKLIFLSIGYSSCHWCHVMERESFHDEEIAKLLNEHFVCIKVDREERPDIDAIYMTALQRLSPARRQRPRRRLAAVDVPHARSRAVLRRHLFPGPRRRPRGLDRLSDDRHARSRRSGRRRPSKIREDAKTVAKFTKAEMESRRGALTVAARRGAGRRVAGGARRAIRPQIRRLRLHARRPAAQIPRAEQPGLPARPRARARTTQQAKEMLVGTLDKMALGGIRDHLGGGFHRYSVDRYWQIPHFEKMLYDNGQLASVYAQAYELTGRDDFRRVSRRAVRLRPPRADRSSRRVLCGARRRLRRRRRQVLSLGEGGGRERC